MGSGPGQTHGGANCVLHLRQRRDARNASPNSSSFLIPIINFYIIRRRFTFPGLNEISETQQEGCPFHTAMGGEFVRLTPVLMAEEHDRVVTILGKVEQH